MGTITVVMPDGTEIEGVPEGTPKSVVLEKYQRSLSSTAQTEQQGQQHQSDFMRALTMPVGVESNLPPPGSPQGAELRDVFRQALVTGGATVGSMVAPQVAIPAGAGRIAAIMPAIANFASRVAGAGVGGAGGEVAGGGDLEQALETGKGEAALEGAFGVAGIAAKPIGKALSPMLKPGAEKAMQFVKSLNLPAPPSMFLQSGKLAKTIEGSTRATIGGTMTMDHYTAKLLDGISEYGEGIAKKITEPLGNDYVAPIVKAKIQDGMSEAAAKAKTLFETDQLAALAKANVNGDALRGAMQSELGGLSDQVMKNVANKLNAIPPANNAAQLNTFRKYLSEVKVGEADKDIVIRMKNKLDSMLGKTTNQELATIAKSWGEIKDLKKNPALSRILKSNNPVYELFSSGNEKVFDLLQKAKVFDDQSWDLIRAQNLANLLEKKRGDALLASIKDNPIYAKAYDGKTIEALNNYGAATKFIDSAKLPQQAQALNKTGLNLGLAYVSPTKTALTNAGAAGLAWDFMRPDGFVKNLLTQGLNPTQKAVMNMAIQSGKVTSRAAVANGE